MVMVTTRINETTNLLVKGIANKKDWSKMKVLRKLIELAIVHKLDKEI